MPSFGNGNQRELLQSLQRGGRTSSVSALHKSNRNTEEETSDLYDTSPKTHNTERGWNGSTYVPSDSAKAGGIVDPPGSRNGMRFG